jgi:AcrR family transcriptional regulator
MMRSKEFFTLTLLRQPSRKAPVQKRRHGLATYEAIVETAVKLLLELGPEALTTTRLSKASGIVQSGFYTHFQNTDEVLVVAAERIGSHLRAVVRGWQEELVKLHGGTVEEVTQHYARIFRLLLEDRHFTELFLQYRRLPTPLGEVLRAFEGGILEDSTKILAHIVRPDDPSPRTIDREQTEWLLEMFWAVADMVIRMEQPEKRLEAVAWQFAVLTKTSVALGYGNKAKVSILNQALTHLFE